MSVQVRPDNLQNAQKTEGTMPRPVSPKLGAWLAAAAVGLLTMTISIEAVRAGDTGLSLADLAGSYAGSGGGSRILCLNFTTGQPEACTDASSSAVQINVAEVLQGTRSAEGDYCVTFTDVASPLGGSIPQAFVLHLPFVDHLIAAGKTTSYDPTTGRGAISMALYDAGEGVSCRGATVVPPAATPFATGSQDFTAGEAPALHLDLVVTSFIDLAGTSGGAVLSSTLYIQKIQNFQNQ